MLKCVFGTRAHTHTLNELSCIDAVESKELHAISLYMRHNHVFVFPAICRHRIRIFVVGNIEKANYMFGLAPQFMKLSWMWANFREITKNICAAQWKCASYNRIIWKQVTKLYVCLCSRARVNSMFDALWMRRAFARWKKKLPETFRQHKMQLFNKTFHIDINLRQNTTLTGMRNKKSGKNNCSFKPKIRPIC